MARISSGVKDLNALIEKLQQGIKPSMEEIEDLSKQATALFLAEPNIVQLQLPVTICGDVHGQFHDVMELFRVAGDVPQANFLFLGDYVDRGHHGVETMALLLALKVRYPSKVTLIRGNHEARAITQVYGFYDECLRKYGNPKVWQYFTNLFDTLPLAAMVGDKVLGIHGGLSPSMESLDDLRAVQRICDVPNDGLMCDIVWSDPDERSGWNSSPRGAGYLFGADKTEEFCYNNNLDFIARAHQLVLEGYRWQFSRRLLTIWSAPNYCYRCGNMAAVLQLDEKMLRDFIVFEAAPAEFRCSATSWPKAPSDYFL